MAAIMIEQVYNFCVDAMTNKSDPRTSNWFLMSSPWPTFALTVLYLLVVWLGPKLMANRKAFDLKPLMILYNFGLVVLSFYMMYEIFVASFLDPKFNKVCQPVDYSNDPNALRLASVSWWYYFSKIIEYMDTVIFILRKKNNQITFLHVYHHSTMSLLWWLGTRFVAGGESLFAAMINCFVHVLMYLYYGLSAFGPSMTKYLWWKRYMTKIQLGQFFVVVFHTMRSMYVNCGYPRGYSIGLMFYMFSLIALFLNFYHKAYVKKANTRPVQNGFAVANGVVTNGTKHLKEN